MRKQAREWIAHGVKKIVIIGIGGSYVGVRAAIDMCTTPFDNQIEFI
jgi:glucose-6-phosphate isomerase